MYNYVCHGKMACNYQTSIAMRSFVRVISEGKPCDVNVEGPPLQTLLVNNPPLTVIFKILSSQTFEMYGYG